METTILIKDKETGREINLSSDDYEFVAAYVRRNDKIDYAKDVLANHLSCQNAVLENIESSIMENDEILEKFADKLEERYEGSGEKEYWCVDELKQELELGIYEAVSNKGTADEQTDKIVLTKEMAENFQDLHALLITSDGETYIDSEYISSVAFVAPYVE